MSGDLKNPSRSIPKGTLGGLGLTFITYTLVILAMAASITRESFYNNVNVIQVVRCPCWKYSWYILTTYRSTFQKL